MHACVGFPPVLCGTRGMGGLSTARLCVFCRQVCVVQRTRNDQACWSRVAVARPGRCAVRSSPHLCPGCLHARSWLPGIGRPQWNVWSFAVQGCPAAVTTAACVCRQHKEETPFSDGFGGAPGVWIAIGDIVVRVCACAESPCPFLFRRTTVPAILGTGSAPCRANKQSHATVQPPPRTPTPPTTTTHADGASLSRRLCIARACRLARLSLLHSAQAAAILAGMANTSFYQHDAIISFLPSVSITVRL